MNILILVHPDCLSEQYSYTPQQAEEYLEKLEVHLPKFDYKIIIRMERVNQDWLDSLNDNQEDVVKQKLHYKKTIEILNKYADIQILDMNCGRSAFANEIGSFLIEHPKSTIYLSGGYQDNCLRLVAQNLTETLNDLIKELEIKVKTYTPLVFYYKKGFGFGNELKEKLPWWDKDWIDQYQKDRKQPTEKRQYKDWGDNSPYPGEWRRGDWWEGATEKLAKPGSSRHTIVANSDYSQQLALFAKQDQDERNEYAKNLSKGKDWKVVAKEYAKEKGRSSDDLFGDALRLKQFWSMKNLPFASFSEKDWFNYWLLAQHSDMNLVFQKQALEQIKKHLGSNHKHAKYLADRISMRETGKQEFGTQTIANSHSSRLIAANHNFTLGLDIDDTICITSPLFTKALQEKGYDIKEENKDASRWYKSSTGNVSKGIEEEVFVDFIKNGTFSDLKVIPGVVELLTKLKKDGVRIVLITARPEGQLGKVTKEWLAKNKIPYDALHFSEDKGPIAEKEGVDLFVDDDLKNAFDKQKVLMINQPWNTKYDGKRIESLSELEELIKKPKTVMQQLKRSFIKASIQQVTCYRGMAGLPAEKARSGLPIPMNPRGMLHFYNGTWEDFLSYGGMDLEQKTGGYGSEGAGVIIETTVSLRKDGDWIIPSVGWAFSAEGSAEEMADHWNRPVVLSEDEKRQLLEIEEWVGDEFKYPKMLEKLVSQFHLVSLKPVSDYKVIYDYKTGQLQKKSSRVKKPFKRNYDFGGNYLDRLKKVLKKKKKASKDLSSNSEVKAEYKDWKVLRVDGVEVRDNIKIDFVFGDNPAHNSKDVPKKTIWIEKVVSKKDEVATLIHELVEYFNMTDKDKDYDNAHNAASKAEQKYRDGGEFLEILEGAISDKELCDIAKNLVQQYNANVREASLKKVSHIMPREPVSEDTDLSGGYIERMKKRLKPIKALLDDLHVFREDEVIHDQIIKELRKKKIREESERRQKNQDQIPTEKIVRKMAFLENVKVRRAERRLKMQKIMKALLLDDLLDDPKFRDLKDIKEFKSDEEFDVQVYRSLRKKKEREEHERARKKQSEVPTENFIKKAFLVKKLKSVATYFRKATKEYYTLEEMLETLVYGIPDLKIEKKIGEKKDFAGCEEESLPFAYGEIPNFINPADEMGWDIIVLPSASALTKEEMIPVGILRYNRDSKFWEGKSKESPIGNDKILLGKRESQGTENGIGIYTQDDAKAFSDFLSEKDVFEKPEFFFEVNNNEH